MSKGQITMLLNQLNGNNKTDLDTIYDLLYHDIKAIANHQLAKVHNNHTISATVLAHECYIKLMQVEQPEQHNRKHLLNYLAKAMRRFLIDQIRSKNRHKRSGVLQHKQMSQVLGAEDVDLGLLEIDRIIDQLATIDPHLADVLQQKVIFNFTFRELADIFDLSERQIIRQWNQARTLVLTMLENKHESD